MKIFSLLGIWEIYQLKTNKSNEGKYFETEVQNGHKVVKENFHDTSSKEFLEEQKSVSEKIVEVHDFT